MFLYAMWTVDAGDEEAIFNNIGAKANRYYACGTAWAALVCRAVGGRAPGGVPWAFATTEMKWVLDEGSPRSRLQTREIFSKMFSDDEEEVPAVREAGHESAPAVVPKVKKARVMAPSLKSSVLVGNGQLTHLLQSLTSSFIIRGDSTDLPRLLDRYAEWARNLEVREQWSSQFMQALDKMPKKEIKAWFKDQRRAAAGGVEPAVRTSETITENEPAAKEDMVQNDDDKEPPPPATTVINDEMRERMRANMERAKQLARQRQEQATQLIAPPQLDTTAPTQILSSSSPPPPQEEEAMIPATNEEISV
jgi:hypothetical protein